MDHLDVGRMAENEDAALGLEAGFLVKVLDVFLGLDFNRVLGEISPDGVHNPVQKLAADALAADFPSGGRETQLDRARILWRRLFDQDAFFNQLVEYPTDVALVQVELAGQHHRHDPSTAG